MPRRSHPLATLGRLLGYVLRAGLPSGEGFWDGVAWFARIVLMGVHLAFGVSAVLRPNTPLLYPVYGAFDDTVPFIWWGWGGLLAVALLWLLPPRVPWGLLSTAYSAFYLYLLSAMFQVGAGLVSAVLLYAGFGGLSGLLLMRAMWAWAEPQPWFRVHVLQRGPSRGR